MISIEEKIDSISEGIMDYIPDTVKQRAKEVYGVGKALVEPEIKGYMRPDVLPMISTQGLAQLGRKAFERGAGPAALAGAGGGAALGAGLASGGLLGQTIGGAMQGFKTGKGKGKLGAALLGALLGGSKGIAKSGARAGLGAGLGAVGGGLAGWRGGREAGAAIAGAGAAGGPLGLLVGPKTALTTAALGGLVGSDIMRQIHQIKQQLVRGGGAGLFKDVQSSR
jgi:hypothetical protein